MTETVLADRIALLDPAQRARPHAMITARTAGDGSIPRIDRSAGRLPMSFAQRRLYFLQQLEPDSAAYNIATAMRLHGRLEVPAVREALANVVARHEVLRTTCTGDGPEPELIVGDEPSLGYLDLSDSGSRQPLVNVDRLFVRLAERPFQLDIEAPLRVTLVRLGEDDHALLLVAHHIASDAWSCGQLVRELFVAYQDIMTGAAPDPEPLPVQYGDYAAWQRAELSDEVVAARLEFWRNQLAGMPPILELPLERPRPATRSGRGADLQLTLDPRLCERIRATARRASVTPFVLLLTAFGYVLHRHCVTDDVVLGAQVSGRNHPDLERVLGCFINTLVLRLDLGAAASRRELVRRANQSTLDALEHDLPFEALVAELNPERGVRANQLVQVMFDYHPDTGLGENPAGLSIRPMSVGGTRARFDLSCEIVEHAGILRATLTYAVELLSRELVSRIGRHFVEVLEALVADLDAPVTSLPAPPAVRCRDDVVNDGELNAREPVGALPGRRWNRAR